MGVVTGTTWAFIEHKTQWISQPAIAISFITWGGYLAMVFLRLTAGWRGRKAAIMVIVVVGLSAVTWFAHARLGVLLLKP
jgi:ABC-type transport system involved in cytochrome c biogenesis permease subunit